MSRAKDIDRRLTALEKQIRLLSLAIDGLANNTGIQVLGEALLDVSDDEDDPGYKKVGFRYGEKKKRKK